MAEPRILPEKLWKCDCGGHVLAVSFYTWKEDPPDWFIEIYEMPGRTSWRWRIRQALNILFDRDVVFDSVSLDRFKAAELVEFLTKSIEEVGGNG